MRGLVTLFQSRLFVRIGTIILLIITATFFGLGRYNAIRERELLQNEHRRAALMMTEALAAGLRSSMLSGTGISVRELIGDARRRLPETSVRVFDRHGAEVFAPPGPPPSLESLDKDLRRVFESGERAKSEADVQFLPLPNEERCLQCHESEKLRGVLAVGKSARATKSPRDLAATEAALVGVGFKQLMTAKQWPLIEGYLGELSQQSEGTLAVGIYDANGTLRYGDDGVELTSAEVTAAARAHGSTPLERAGRLVHLVPLPNEPRCQSCHALEKGAIRGVLSLSLDPAADGDALVLRTLDRTLRNIMLAGLGRLVAAFLSEAAVLADVPVLRLFDAKGRLYHDAHAVPRPPAKVARVLEHGRVVAESTSGGGQFTFVSPLRNDKECTRCHGSDHEIRGAVEIITSTVEAKRAQIAAQRRAEWSGLGAASLVLISLWLLIKFFVIDRIRHVGDIAKAVGQGRLNVAVHVPSSDEIGVLGSRMNEMIEGLQVKFNLERFVSAETVAAAKDAGGAGVMLGGARHRVTVWFSDIRGFTSYSEKVEPEKVVAMLNRVLRAQCEVIARHGGDIDKFVGDEIVAVFRGDDRAIRAIRAGLDAMDAVASIDLGGEQISIGVGINDGDVVLGSVGHESRMDFTVIGDTVNVGARLCAAAERGQVLLSKSVVNQAEAPSDIVFRDVPAIRVKGKSDSLQVFVAERKNGTTA